MVVFTAGVGRHHATGDGQQVVVVVVVVAVVILGLQSKTNLAAL